MKILVPLDGSKFSEAIIGPASNLAANAGAEFLAMFGTVRSSSARRWVARGGAQRCPLARLLTRALMLRL